MITNIILFILLVIKSATVTFIQIQKKGRGQNKEENSFDWIRE